MTGHRQIPSKTSCVHLMFQQSQRWSEIWLLSWKKNSFVLPSLWFDEMDINIIEVFGNSQLGGTDQRSCLN